MVGIVKYNFSDNNTKCVIEKNGTYFAVTVDQFIELEKLMVGIRNGDGKHYAKDIRRVSSSTDIISNPFITHLNEK